MPKKTLEQLHNFIINEQGVDNVVKFDEFSKIMQDSSSVRQAYDFLKSKGQDLIEFEDFRNSLKIDFIESIDEELSRPIGDWETIVEKARKTKIEAITGMGIKPAVAEPATTKTVPPSPTIEEKPKIGAIDFYKKLGFEFLSGIYETTAGSLYALDSWSKWLSDKTGLKRGELFKELADSQKWHADYFSKHGLGKGASGTVAIAKHIYKGIGSATMAIPMIMSVGLPAYSAIHGGAEAIEADESVLKGTAVGFAHGLLLHGILQGAGIMRLPERAMIGATTFGGASLGEEMQKPAEQRDYEKVIADFFVGGGLLIAGKGKMTTKDIMRDIRNTYGKEKVDKSLEVLKRYVETEYEKPTEEIKPEIKKEIPVEKKEVKPIEEKVEKVPAEKKIEKKPIKIPKKLESLVKVARRYSTAGKFIDARLKLKGQIEAWRPKLEKAGFEDMVHFWEQATKEKPKVTKITKDLAFNPKNLKTPKSKDFDIEKDKIVKRSEIAKYISEKLDVPIRRGKFRKKALGIYKEKPKLIRIKAGDIRTISHEVGHYLDDIIPNTFSKKIRNIEMNSLLKEYPDVKIINKHKEAFSEFLRFYVTEPVKAKKNAFNFYKYFEKTIEKYPEIKDVLLSARQDYQRWLKMPAASKVLSQISIKEEKAGIKEKIVGKIEDLYKTTLDDLFPIKQFVALAKKRGIEIPAEEEPYILARVMKGWISKANTFLEKGTFNKKFWEMRQGKAVPVFKGKSFKSILRPIEKKNRLEDLSIYLVSKHTIELNKYGIKTGIETKDAKASIKELESKYFEFPKIAKDLYKFQDDVLLYGHQCGLYDNILLAKLKAKYKYYVPFYRVFEELQSRGYFGKGFANISKQIKRIKGSEREIINPLESIVKNTYTIINAGDRNQVGVMMANLAAKDKELARLFEEIPVPMTKVAQVELKELGIDFTGMTEKDMGEIMDIFRPSLFLPKDNVLPVLMDGAKKYFQVEPNLYKAMMAMEREEMGPLVKLLSAPTRWLRAGAILTPEFMIRNPIRDVMTAFVYSKYGFIPIYDNIKGIFSLVKKDNDYWSWRMGGGEHSMLVSMDRMYLKKSFDEIVKGKKFTNYVKSPLEVLRIFAEISEKINRLPEAKRALVKGKSPIEAAFASRDITLDFAKGGATGRVLNRIIAFWKAWALGWEKMIVEHKNYPAKTAALGIMGITIPSIVLYLINRDDPRYKEIAQWQKDLFWIVFTSDPPENWNKMSIEEKKKHLSFLNQLKYGIYRIYRPFELGILYGSIPERILEYIDRKDPEVIKKLGQNILSSQSPGITPTALEPWIENWSNYDFFLDRPVVPRGKEALPPEAQYTGRSSEVAKKLGELFKYPPAKIDNLLYGYFAGLGKYATGGIDKILKGTGISSSIPEPSPTLADRPIIKAFIVRRPIGSASESVDRFYDKLKDYEAKEKMLKHYRGLNEKEKYYKYRDKYPEVLLTYDFKTKNFYSIPARHFRKTARDISEYRKKETLVYNSKTMTSEEKRAKITEIDKIITKLAQRAMEYTKYLKEEIKK